MGLNLLLGDFFLLHKAVELAADGLPTVVELRHFPDDGRVTPFADNFGETAGQLVLRDIASCAHYFTVGERTASYSLHFLALLVVVLQYSALIEGKVTKQALQS